MRSFLGTNTNIRVDTCEHTGKELLEYKGLTMEWARKPHYRHINIKVYEDLSLKITTGKKAPLKWIESFLKENSYWIENSLAKHADQIRLLKKAKIFPKPYVGGWVPYLGYPFMIETVDKLKEQRIDLERKKIFIAKSKEDSLQEELGKLYKKAAQNYISKLQQDVSHRMMLYPQKLSFRNQKTRWGSCSSTGQISYNWKLMAAPGAWIEYVVIHETAHLMHMDHSKAFWGLVSEYCPKFRLYSEEMKNKHAVFDFFDAKSNLYKIQRNFPKTLMV